MATQFKFFSDGKHLKTFSKRYRSIFTKSMIEHCGKRLSANEKLRAEIALHISELPLCVRGFVSDTRWKMASCAEVTNFYGEKYYVAIPESGPEIKINGDIYRLWLAAGNYPITLKRNA